MSTSDENIMQVADFLVEGKPQIYRRNFDGSLTVINERGQKFTYTPEEVAAAEKALAQVKKARSIETTKPPAAKKPPSKPKKA
jgi:hypothetical protein